MVWIIVVAAILAFLLLLYFFSGLILLNATFKRQKKPFKFKGPKLPYDFSPDMDFLTRSDAKMLSLGGKKPGQAFYIPYSSVSHNYLIFLHGFKGSYASHSRMFHEVAEGLKANTLSLVLPGDRESLSSAYCTMGIKESQELLAWCHYINEKDPLAKLYIYGVSMGASSVIFASASYPKNVVGVVADSGFSSIRGELNDVLRHSLKFLTPVLLSSTAMWYRFLFKTSWNSLSDKELGKCSIPFFFIHGEKDTFVPPYNLEHHKQMKEGKAETWLIPNCPHGIGDFVDPEGFVKRVVTFYLSC